MSLRRGAPPPDRRTHSSTPNLTRRTIVRDEQTGREYEAIDRVMGAICTDPFVIHTGLHGFMGPEFIPPTVELVARRQLVRTDKKRGSDG